MNLQSGEEKVQRALLTVPYLPTYNSLNTLHTKAFLGQVPHLWTTENVLCQKHWYLQTLQS